MGRVVDRGGSGGRRTERQVILTVHGASIIAEGPVAPCILGARLNRAPLSRKQGGVSAGLYAAVLGSDVHHAAGGIAISRRKDAVDQIEALDEKRVQHRNKRRIRVDVERNQNPVDLVLKSRSLSIADVHLLVLVDSDSRQLGENIRQDGVLTRGHV